MTSIDGVTWVMRTTPNNTHVWSGLCWSPEKAMFVATAIGGTDTRVMVSLDGITWLLRPTPIDNNWAGVCWAPALNRFIAVGDGAGTVNKVMTSD